MNATIDPTDPIDYAYHRLAATVLLQAIRDAESGNDRCAAAAQIFLDSEHAEIWADRVGIEPAAWRAAMQGERKREAP